MKVDYEKLDKLSKNLEEHNYIEKGKSKEKEKELKELLKPKKDREDKQMRFDI